MSTGKCFIGGLSWETTEEGLTAYYTKFGTVTDAVIMKDRHTGQPRGFGFVTFEDPEVAASVCGQTHTIDDRQVETKVSIARDKLAPGQPVSGPATAPQPTPYEQPRNPEDANCRKLFLGGLASTSTEESLRDYFAKFGEIEEIMIMKERATGVSRGFGFCTFKHDGSGGVALKQGRMHHVDDKAIEIKPAETREQCNAKSQTYGAKGGGYGGKGGPMRSGAKGGYGAPPFDPYYGGYGGGHYAGAYGAYGAHPGYGAPHPQAGGYHGYPGYAAPQYAHAQPDPAAYGAVGAVGAPVPAPAAAPQYAQAQPEQPAYGAPPPQYAQPQEVPPSYQAPYAAHPQAAPVSYEHPPAMNPAEAARYHPYAR